ncbi:maleylacetoacetate isomerase [Caenorhabditis elegans]|uniref:maleylacetoacetate isomerase n=1 Tax=Caenorhabditis elegans TaxID=6239 RepID=Q9N4H6_CAEEL|nr:maleylacetoacetate isomerase [Caenorhabditis elegans]CCD73500.1 maleylacetoacetate isomerase [Caenorhabditis elegans]|eukprot:NP_491070.1 Glutathione S-Transferase [Caenorhabditis elegans]
MAKPILYSYWRSSCAWRVRIALALKNIDYEYRPIDLFSEESKNNAEFVKHNPAKKVPTLVINGLSLTESLAIIEYLDEAYPDPPFLPKELDKRSYSRAIALHIVASIQPLQAINIHKMLNEKEPGYGDFWCNHFVNKGFLALEELLKKHSGKYCVGDQLTIADINLPSIIYNAKIYKVDMSKYPTITRINEILAEDFRFKLAHPDNQPDAPNKN